MSVIAKVIKENEQEKLKRDYENLKHKYEIQGKKNNELHHLNQFLVSENTILKEMVCEKLDILPNVLEANIKMYRQEKRTRELSIRFNEFIKQSKEYQKNVLKGKKQRRTNNERRNKM